MNVIFTESCQFGTIALVLATGEGSRTRTRDLPGLHSMDRVRLRSRALDAEARGGRRAADLGVDRRTLDPGERVVAYVDHLGRLEGTIVRVHPSGFAMTIAATSRKRDKLAAQLTWLANRHILDMPEDRRHERVSHRDQMVTLVLDDGSQEQCAIVDLSVSGVAVAATAFAIG